MVEKVALIPELLQASRATNTCRSYERGFMRWRKWASSHSLGPGDIFPARILHVAIYLSSIIQTANSSSPVINAFYSLKWMHDIYGLRSPTDSKLIQNILEAGKRKLSKSVVKKEPITVSLLKSMYDSLYCERNVKSQRTICACLLAYAGFLRSAELLLIKRSDICFESTYISLFVENSKTDQYRDGAWILIARTGTSLCPVRNLEKYLLWANIDDNSDEYIFRCLSACKSGYKLRDDGKPLSYTALRECFIDAFKSHVDISKFGLHSLRAGGATAAAKHGVKDRMFKRHGRWVSEKAKDGYVKDDVSERLSVSMQLGL